MYKPAHTGGLISKGGVMGRIAYGGAAGCGPGGYMAYTAFDINPEGTPRAQSPHFNGSFKVGEYGDLLLGIAVFAPDEWDVMFSNDPGTVPGAAGLRDPEYWSYIDLPPVAQDSPEMGRMHCLCRPIVFVGELWNSDGTFNKGNLSLDEYRLFNSNMVLGLLNNPSDAAGMVVNQAAYFATELQGDILEASGIYSNTREWHNMFDTSTQVGVAGIRLNFTDSPSVIAPLYDWQGVGNSRSNTIIDSDAAYQSNSVGRQTTVQFDYYTTTAATQLFKGAETYLDGKFNSYAVDITNWASRAVQLTTPVYSTWPPSTPRACYPPKCGIPYIIPGIFDITDPDYADMRPIVAVGTQYIFAREV